MSMIWHDPHKTIHREDRLKAFHARRHPLATPPYLHYELHIRGHLSETTVNRVLYTAHASQEHTAIIKSLTDSIIAIVVSLK